jgi:hypothetical protein
MNQELHTTPDLAAVIKEGWSGSNSDGFKVSRMGENGRADSWDK